jgi:putative aminopeptidase FrvX
MDESTDSTHDHLFDELSALTAIDGVSGHEGPVIAALRERFAGIVSDVTVDAMGNLYARREGGSGRHVMIEAHSDEIGFLVAAIEPDGWLRVQAVGGVSPAVAQGRVVAVRGATGVIGLRSGHLSRGEISPVDLDGLYVDLGFDSREQVERLGIRVGDGVVLQNPLRRLANATRIAGKAIDNRAGCVVLLETLRALASESLAGPLTAVVAVQEEVGMKGARIAAERVRPDLAIVVDTVPCADTPDSHGVTTFPARLGAGPVVQISSGRAASGYLMPEWVRDTVVSLADAAGIPYQLAAFAFGDTDASGIYDAAGGIPTVVVTMPRRYSHSPVEVLDLRDLESAIRLCGEIVRHADRFTPNWMDQ